MQILYAREFIIIIIIRSLVYIIIKTAYLEFRTAQESLNEASACFDGHETRINIDNELIAN